RRSIAPTRCLRFLKPFDISEPGGSAARSSSVSPEPSFRPAAARPWPADSPHHGDRGGCLTARVREPTITRALEDPAVEHPRPYNAAVDLIGRNLAAGRGNKVAYIDDTRSCTYAQLAERVDRAAHVLRSMGIRREE